LNTPIFVGTIAFMANTRGRPRKTDRTALVDYLEVRLQSSEKRAFKDAAELAGLPLSAWVRERLRSAARRELAETGIPVAFLG
jgi:hypothetical protein